MRKTATKLAILKLNEGRSGVVLARKSRVLLSPSFEETIVMSLARHSVTGAHRKRPILSAFGPVSDRRKAS